MRNKQILTEAEHFVYDLLKDDASGHDYYHVKRVVELAKHIQKNEGGTKEIILLAAWLHDVDDYKLKTESHSNLDLFFEQNDIETIDKQRIMEIIQSISFHKSFEAKTLSLEAKIVQDADRLDAIGAIGIARTFAFGGTKGNIMYHPDIKPNTITTEEQYKKNKSTTVNHFYEKLLLLRGKLNTETAQKIGQKRHDVMLKFLDEFYEEWNFTA